MKYLSLDFKYNERILALYYPFYYNGYFLVPVLDRSGLDFIDFINALELNNWQIFLITNTVKFKEWFNYKFEKLSALELKNINKDYSINFYYFDLGQLVLFLIDKLDEKMLKDFKNILYLEDSDIYAIMKLKTSSEELNLPYFIYQTKEFHYTFGKILDKYYISIKFADLDSYLKYLEKIGKF